MKRSIISAFLLFACFSAIADDAADVISTLHEACKAFEDGNADRIEALLTEDFTLTDDSGVITTRADEAGNVRSGAIKYRVFQNRDMKVRLHGDAAVVTGITKVAGTAGKTEFAVEFQFTDTLVRKNGVWRVAASHVSRLAAK